MDTPEILDSMLLLMAMGKVLDDTEEVLLKDAVMLDIIAENSEFDSKKHGDGNISRISETAGYIGSQFCLGSSGNYTHALSHLGSLG